MDSPEIPHPTNKKIICSRVGIVNRYDKLGQGKLVVAIRMRYNLVLNCHPKFRKGNKRHVYGAET